LTNPDENGSKQGGDRFAFPLASWIARVYKP
jgi:hypothetical protein